MEWHPRKEFRKSPSLGPKKASWAMARGTFFNSNKIGVVPNYANVKIVYCHCEGLLEALVINFYDLGQELPISSLLYF